MSQPLAFLNGQFLPASQLSLSVHDLGFVQGVTISERMRTFGGKLFRLAEHLQRLARSLEMVGIQLPADSPPLDHVAARLVEANYRLLPAGHDLGLSLFVTPGEAEATAVSKAGHCRTPTLCLHTNPLPFGQWADWYQNGQRLVITDIMQVPHACWPEQLKCRSRMHYYLADRQADLKEPGARSLLLDAAGCVTEASTANVLMYCRNRGLVSPPLEKILPGISMGVVAELARQIGMPFCYGTLRPEDLAGAEEVMLCSTSPCVWPVVRIGGIAIADGRPGPVFQQVLQAWGQLVGLDIADQARQFARNEG